MGSPLEVVDVFSGDADRAEDAIMGQVALGDQPAHGARRHAEERGDLRDLQHGGSAYFMEHWRSIEQIVRRGLVAHIAR